jgi:ABC-type multidrug transport system fused ATPase/permease subunit
MIQSLVPAATAYTLAFLVGRLTAEDTVSLSTAGWPLAALGFVVVAGRVLPELLAPMTFLAEQRIDGSQRNELLSIASSTATIDTLEHPRVQELIRLARADREFWTERTPGQGALAQLDLIFAYLGVVASSVVLASYAWWLVPLVLIPTIAARSVLRRQFREHVRLEGAGTMAGIRSENWRRVAIDWTGGKEVRVFGLAQWAVDQAQHHIREKFAPTWAAAVDSARRQWQIGMIVGPALLVAYAHVAWTAADGRNSVAMAAAVFAASWSMLTALGFVDVALIEGAVPGVRAFNKLRDELQGLSLRAAPADVSAARWTSGPPPRVCFEGVSFTYPGTDRLILDGVDLEIRSGELLAVVGLNGAGKSTLIKLLTGLYTPTSGRITAGGVDIADMGADVWRRYVSAAFQDFIQYPLSAMDNVAMATAGIGPQPELVATAAHDAGLNAVIERLPEGWRTPLARSRRDGVDLSGGQWQQVVLARTLYGLLTGARVAVADEPTAHLDVRTEAMVFDCLAKYRGDSTVVLISHRLSTVRRADRIVLLHAGRITESGTHDELMDRNSRYAEMFRTQAARFQHDAELQPGEENG